MWSDVARKRVENRAGAACEADASSLRLVGGCHNDRTCDHHVDEVRDYWRHLREDNERTASVDRVDVARRTENTDQIGSREKRPSYAGPVLGDVPKAPSRETVQRAINTYRRTVLLPSGSVIDVLA